MPSEEEVDVLVAVYAEGLSYDFDGQYLRVGELWSGTALTDTPSFTLRMMAPTEERRFSIHLIADKALSQSLSFRYRSFPQDG